MKISDNTKNLSEIVVAWITLVGVAIGGVLGYHEFRDHQRSDRVERTMKYMERYHSVPMTDYRVTLDDALDNMYPDIVKALHRNSTTESELDFERRFNSVILNNVRNNQKLRIATRATLDFFEELALCDKANLCDTDAMLALFGHSAQSFFRVVYPYVCQQRTLWKDDSMYDDLEASFNPNSLGRSCKNFEAVTNAKSPT